MNAAPASQPRGAGAAVHLSHVGKTFDAGAGRFAAVEDVSLDIPAGAFVAIVGASGCGKSTLLRMIAGLDQPDSGRIHVGGRPVSGTGLNRGLVFQEPRLLPWLTAAGNVALALRNRRVGARPAPARSHRPEPAYTGLGLAWMFVAAAELMGASDGLGFLLMDAEQTGRPERVIAAILLFAVCGKASDRIVQRIGLRLRPRQIRSS